MNKPVNPDKLEKVKPKRKPKVSLEEKPQARPRKPRAKKIIIKQPVANLKHR